jgi:hypothetical protein
MRKALIVGAIGVLLCSGALMASNSPNSKLLTHGEDMFRLWSITDPDTGCEYLGITHGVYNEGRITALTPRMNGTVQMGCTNKP